MKGKTIIELTDIRTGKTERKDDLNAFMSANIQKKFNDYGIFSAGVQHTFYNVPFWQKLAGGILLLDSTVTDNNNFVDLGTKMTGRGYYGSSNNGAPVSLGSWNASESAITADSIQMVYDFTTSQANGTINSVCLTSDYAGRVGIGNTAGDYNNNYVVNVEAWQNNSFSISDNITNIGNNYAFDGDIIYFNPVISGTTLTLTKKIANAKSFDIIQMTGGAYNIGSASITLSAEMTYNSNLRLLQASNTRLLLVGYDNSSDSAFSVADIDLSTNAATVYEVSGMPALSSNLASYYYNAAECIGIDADGHPHIAIPTYEYIATCFAVDIVSGEIVTFKDTSRTNSYQLYSTVRHIGSGFFLYSFGISAAYGYICDYSDESMLPCEGYGPRVSHNLGGVDVMALNAQAYISLTQNPFYLATINNLSETVTKTASKTMKVTYILTRD